MPFDWLKDFQQDLEKPPNYAEKTLNAYRLGMRAKGSIAGVRVIVAPDGCAAAQEIDPQAVFHPDDAPQLPLPACSKGRRCRCVYRPVMTYEVE